MNDIGPRTPHQLNWNLLELCYRLRMLLCNSPSLRLSLRRCQIWMLTLPTTSASFPSSFTDVSSNKYLFISFHLGGCLSEDQSSKSTTCLNKSMFYNYNTGHKWICRRGWIVKEDVTKWMGSGWIMRFCFVLPHWGVMSLFRGLGSHQRRLLEICILESSLSFDKKGT